MADLRERFLVLAEFKPLKLGVHRDLRAALDGVSGVKIGKALLCHTNHGRYLETLAAGGPRYALDGFEVGAVSLKERKRAAARLKRRGPEPEPDRLAMRLVRKIEGRQPGQACSKENPCKGELSDQMETRP
ncbi:MAG: ProQ/FinO family protein [Candidatus Competibacteraceae bacterium]|nr:ProQ/FinO family protein [Candidatus Competibacteraceae bacterium]MBK8897007.1 ProQ/FinO family protein [Candidatus Competibacteraceae bacterium]